MNEHLATVTITTPPVPAGSKRAVAARYKDKGSGKMRISTWFDKKGNQHARIMVHDVNEKRLKVLHEDVAEQVPPQLEEQGFEVPDKDAPLAVQVTFFKPRNKGDYKADGSLKDSAPAFPAKVPDTTKLWRGVEDALTGILWHDDSRLTKQEVEEAFIDSWELARVEVSLYARPRTVADIRRVSGLSLLESEPEEEGGQGTEGSDPGSGGDGAGDGAGPLAAVPE